MQYLFAAPALTRPTLDTLETYSRKMFAKMEKFLKSEYTEPVLRISVHKEGSEFIVTVEVHAFEKTIVRDSNRNLRRAIESTSRQLKTKILKDKDRKFSLPKTNEKIQRMRNDVLNRNYIED
jgi:ribosome-associated translation inhibitor RaiA